MREELRAQGGWKAISPANMGKRVYVPADYYQYFADILAQQHYAARIVNQGLLGLTAGGITEGSAVNMGGEIRSVTLVDGTKIEYHLNDGDVLVESMKASPKLASQSGIYTVAYDEYDEQWIPKEAIETSYGLEKQWPISHKVNGSNVDASAHFVAVGGHFQSVEQAADKLAGHIIGAYSQPGIAQFTRGKVERQNSTFSLVYIQAGQHNSQSAKDLLGMAIQHATNSGVRVHTLVQGEAAGTFARLAQTRQVSGNETQQFYFSNPRGASVEALKKACEQMSVTYMGTRTNPHDLRQRVRNSAGEIYYAETQRQRAAKILKTAMAASVGGYGVQKTVESAVTDGKLINTTLKNAGEAAYNTSADIIANAMALLGPGVEPAQVLAALAAGGMGAFLLVDKVQKAASKTKKQVQQKRSVFNSTFGHGNRNWVSITA